MMQQHQPTGTLSVWLWSWADKPVECVYIINQLKSSLRPINGSNRTCRIRSDRPAGEDGGRAAVVFALRRGLLGKTAAFCIVFSTKYVANGHLLSPVKRLTYSAGGSSLPPAPQHQFSDDWLVQRWMLPAKNIFPITGISWYQETSVCSPRHLLLKCTKTFSQRNPRSFWFHRCSKTSLFATRAKSPFALLFLRPVAE